MSAATVIDLNHHRQTRFAGNDPVAALAIELGLDPVTLTPTDRRWLAHESERIAYYRTKSRAENTLCSYGYWCERWVRWCTDPSVRRQQNTTVVFEPWPASPAVIRMFLTDWVGDGYETTAESADRDDDGYQPPAPSTVSQFLSALRWKHRQERHPDLTDDILSDLVRGLRRAWLEADFRVRRAEPLMLEDVLVICEWLQDHRVATSTLRDGAVVACYTSGLGLSETGRTRISDLQIEDGVPLGVFAGDGDERQLHAFDQEAQAAMAAWLDRYRSDGIDGSAPLVPTVRPDGQITAKTPSRQQIRGVLCRVTRTTGHPGWSTADPLTADQARAMYRTCREVDRAVVRDHSVIIGAFWGALRRSEATGLDIGDVNIRDGVGVTLELGITKNNQLGAKDSLAFVPIANGKGMDAVAVNREWLAILETTGDASPARPFYRRISRTGVVSGPDEGSSGRLDKASVNAIIRRRLIDAGLATDNPDDTSERRDVSNFTGHSPRRGLITTLAEAGYDTAEIARYSRHTDPGQLQVYVDNARLADPSRHPATTLQALRQQTTA